MSVTKPLVPMTMSYARERGITVVSRNKVANQLALKQGDYPGLSTRANVIIRDLNCGKGRHNSQQQGDVIKEKLDPCWLWKWKTAMNQGT